jgi:hypothetical protein
MYPTKEEILNSNWKVDQLDIKIIKKWKKEDWIKVNKKEEPLKQEALKRLLNQINKNHGDTSFSVTFNKTKDCYNQRKKEINLSKTSIITALHELAHHIYGASELKACCFSIFLFKKTFKKSFNNLTWNKHLLIKN